MLVYFNTMCASKSHHSELHLHSTPEWLLLFFKHKNSQAQISGFLNKDQHHLQMMPKAPELLF